jgi:hypothetical protein
MNINIVLSPRIIPVKPPVINVETKPIETTSQDSIASYLSIA